jgi:hypothetical protein
MALSTGVKVGVAVFIVALLTLITILLVKKFKKSNSCDPGDDTVVGAADYIKDSTGNCVVNTCNTISGYISAPVNNLCTLATTTCDPGTKTVVGAVDYKKDSTGNCVVNTCNPITGYNLNPVNNLCVQDTPWAIAVDKIKCVTGSSSLKDEAHCTKQSYLDTIASTKDNTYVKTVCKDDKYTSCKRSVPVGCADIAAHNYCGTLSADDCSKVLPDVTKCST